MALGAREREIGARCPSPGAAGRGFAVVDLWRPAGGRYRHGEPAGRR